MRRRLLLVAVLVAMAALPVLAQTGAPSEVPVRLLPQTPLALLTLVAIPIGLAVAFWRGHSPTFVFAAGILLTFFVQLLAGELRMPGVMAELSLRPYLYVRGWQWWAVFTHMFLHGGFLHLIGNLILLVLVGPRLEDYISERNFILLYLAAGFAGGAASLLLFGDDVQTGLVPNVGASGAIFGILAAFAMRLPREKIPIPVGFMIFVPAYVAFPLYVLMQFYFIFAQNNVAWWAHFAGAAVGAVFAYFWKPEKPDALTWETIEPEGM